MHYQQHNTSIKLIAGRQTDRPIDTQTDLPSDRPTVMVAYRAAIAANNIVLKM